MLHHIITTTNTTTMYNNNENDNAFFNNQHKQQPQQHDEQHHRQRQLTESHNNDYPCHCPGYQPYNSDRITPEQNIYSHCSEEHLRDVHVSEIFAIIYVYIIIYVVGCSAYEIIRF